MPCMSSRLAVRRAIPRVGEHDDGRSVENPVGVEVPWRVETKHVKPARATPGFSSTGSSVSHPKITSLTIMGRDERRETREVDFGGIGVQIVDGRILDVVVRCPD